MKKKTGWSVNKKLQLSKKTLISLNTAAQKHILGGVDVMERQSSRPQCDITSSVSFEGELNP
ncbi:class I lanthipeptide [Chitinophaga nivalis]|uniref:Class I lanthipeptide n=1 Tax=Chitinophaga nivalis TaxID=2991709 RepID=A0ABT3IH98_9BACT|nr:class I lanthipeptide [Chitinophaga nivalis]MCW3467134.1 class I lanthipeptide [Chitinophaga nivalis]MCW3483175.1 class I lanthipeptide [Chitinophaga nivalis]